MNHLSNRVGTSAKWAILSLFNLHSVLIPPHSRLRLRSRRESLIRASELDPRSGVSTRQKTPSPQRSFSVALGMHDCRHASVSAVQLFDFQSAVTPYAFRTA